MTKDTAIAPIHSKIDALNQGAWNIRVYDSPKAFELSKEAVELARKDNYTEGLAKALLVFGFCYIRHSKYEEALPLIKESLSLFESLGDTVGQATAYEYLALIQRNWGDLGGALNLLFKALELTGQNGYRENWFTNNYQLGVTYKHLGNYEKALEYLFISREATRQDHNELYESYSINVIGSIYLDNGDYDQALDYYQQGLIGRQKSGDKWGEAGSLDNIGFTYLKLKDYTRAIQYCTQGLEICRTTGDKNGQSNSLLHLAEIHKQINDIELAIKYSNESLEIRKSSGNKRGEAEILLFLAGLESAGVEKNNLRFQRLSDALAIAEEIKDLNLLSKTHFYLYEYYKQKGNYEEALKHFDLHNNLEKEFHKNTINQKIANLDISHKAEEAKNEAEAVRLRNEELTKLNKEIEAQKNRLEEVVADLKATQAQLIQSEKMASLGELTAGIAHEIQNPLNFVNNFSEINKELLAEMNEEIKNENYDEVKAIAASITENEEKINHHGKRADAIVKGMLQHSRSSSGVKELTDINALADEYLRLAYHGLRAKDKTFNATIKTELDKTIGNISIVPQDVGRVILNLITNAFYAVTEKKNTSEGSLGHPYEPIVTVTTKLITPSSGGRGAGAEISVTDNGNGIPQKILEKIFQPFFTTKPTGQGTGLGLSLSYDIIKAHGGEIKVETKEGEGTTFTIQLPFQT